MSRAPVLRGVAALIGLIAFNAALGFFLTGLENKPTANHPSYTVSESKSRGAFVEMVAFEPAVVDWNGRRIVIKEAWLEQQTELDFIYVIVPFCWEYHYHRKVTGYNLCFNLAEGWDVLWGLESPFFVPEGKGHGFGHMGDVVLWERLDTLASCPTKVFVTNNWKFENSQTLTVQRQGR